MRIAMRVVAAAVFCIASPVLQAQELPPVTVTEVAAHPQEAGGVLVTIRATTPARYSTFRLGAMEGLPPRFVVEIEGSVLADGVLNLPVNAGGVVRVRASQFSVVPPVVRVVVDLESAEPIRVLDDSPSSMLRVAIGDIDDPSAGPVPSGGSTADEPPGWGPTQAEFVPEQRPAQALHLISVEPMGFQDGKVSFRLVLDGPSDPVFFAQARPCRLVLDIPGAAPQATLGRPDGWASVEGWVAPPIRSVRIFEIPDGRVLSSRLVIDAERLMPYDLERDRTDPFAWVFSIMIEPVLNRVVVIDPGHGGVDCGALDDSGNLHEADLVLPLALGLRAELISRGICPILTRTANTTVDLYHRPYIANQTDAELFLSIHLNAVAVGRASGSLVLYTHPSSLPFARAVQSELVNALQLPDMGCRREDLVVTRLAEMPAVLAEVLFIDNPQELALLQNPSTRGRIVEALANGIERALSTAANP